MLSSSRHTVANYLYRAGATAFKHFTAFYVFLGGPPYDHLDRLFVSVIALAERHVPEDHPIRVRFDGTTSKKTGRTIDGAEVYRNGAGSARQEYRTLWGVNFIIGEMLIPLDPWPDGFISVPIRPYTELGSYGVCPTLEPKVVQATGQIHHPIPQPMTP